ncbi:MAG: metallophosphoesterase family protein [Candidatus Hinthialibacter antarcticus]|nr:metallophosphoesterase family protein [Candidatus Hinthialibacter antarcticus]
MPIQRFGFISDTHGEVHPALTELFAGVQAIYHGGDVVGAQVLDALNAIAPTFAVAGNCDSLGDGLPLSRVVDAPFGRIGIAHGHLYSADKIQRYRQMLTEFKGDDVRVILTGHSHQQHLEFSNNIFLVNPGSASRPRLKMQSSVCMMEWDPQTDLLRFDFVPLKC